MKIALFCVYFGSFPSYFSAFLKSAEFNSNYDFYIYTDNEINSIKTPKNVKLVNTTFMSIKQELQQLFDFQICLNTPYKLTDFKPVYGQLFEKDISAYSHWGYFDLDIVLGDLSLFATEEELFYFDRIGSRGHLSIFKNNDKNKLAYKSKNVSKSFNYREAFRSKYSYHFDEMWGINNIFEGPEYKFKDETQGNSVSYFDASPKIYPLLSADECFSKKKAIFIWNKGTLSLYQQERIVQEVSYVHLQKRKMKYVDLAQKKNIIIIDQSQIIVKDNIDAYVLPTMYKKQITKWPTGNIHHTMKYYFNTLISGEQLSRLKLKLRK